MNKTGIGGVTPRTILYREMVNDAMVKANGDRKLAAQLLEITEKKLSIKLNTCAILKARWGLRPDHSKSPLPMPEPIDTLNRDLLNKRHSMIDDKSPYVIPKVEELSSNDLALAKAMSSEDEKITQGLRNMGMSEDEVKIALACQKHGEGFYRESLQIIGGGATRLAIMIQAEASNIKNRLAAVRTKLDVEAQEGKSLTETRTPWVDEELGLMKMMAVMATEARKMMEMGFKGSQIQAAIEGNKVRTMKRAKLGFDPPMMNGNQQ